MKKDPKTDNQQSPYGAASSAKNESSVDVGGLIKSARARSNQISAAELSEKLGVSNSYLTMIETGKRPLRRSTLKAIDDLIDIPKDDYNILWAHASRGKGDYYDSVVNNKIVTSDPYREETVIAFIEALCDSKYDDLKNVYENNEEIEVVAKRGNSNKKRDIITFTMRVG